MGKDNIAVGLDIGTTKIVAMIGRQNEYGKLEILGIGKSAPSKIFRLRMWYSTLILSKGIPYLSE